MSDFFVGIISLLFMYFGNGAPTDYSENNTEMNNGVIHVPENEISDDTAPDKVTENAENTWYRPPVLSTWQWQLSGDVNIHYDVDIYNIDLFESSPDLINQIQISGKKVICYFSAGTYEKWRPDSSLFTASDLGNALENWPGERWLDIRSKNVKSIMKKRLDLAKSKGCDGIEPDNIDGYSNKNGLNLNSEDQLYFNKIMAKEAHDRGMAIGLKNNLEQALELVDFFDYAINEQCFQYDECHLLAPFIKQNKPVFNVEYQMKYIRDSQKLNALCSESINGQFSTLVLPLNLDDKYRYSCL